MTIMSWSPVLLLLLSLTAILSVAQLPAGHLKNPQPQPIPDQFAGLSCSRFEWNSENSHRGHHQIANSAHNDGRRTVEVFDVECSPVQHPEDSLARINKIVYNFI
jgi:hypothetical protein